MANIYDMAAAIKPVDIVGNIQHGFQFGAQQRQLAEQRQQAAEQRQREQTVRGLAPQILAGDPAAYNQAAAADPKMAGDYMDARDGQLKKMQGMVSYIDNARAQAKQSGDPRYLNAAMQQVAPYIQQLTGKQLPAEWTPDMDAGWDAFKAQVEGAQSVGNDMPTGYREFQMKAKAAGLQPGTSEYEQAAKIALGMEGRAASGGFSSDTIEWNGRKYPARFNPRNGVKELWDGSQWVQLGGAAGGPPPQADAYTPAEDGSQIPLQTIRGPDGSIYRVQVGDQNAAQVGAADSSVGGAATNVQFPDRSMSQFSGGALPAGIGVSRTPEEQTAANEAAKIQTQLQYADQQAQAEADAARRKKEAEAQAELSAQAPKRIKQYEQALSAAGNVETSIDKALKMIGATSTGFWGARTRGVEGSPAYNLAAELETIKANLGFDRLQQMRDNSPTGGALGAIAVQELVALQSTIANLDPNQSAEQLKENLDRIKQHYQSWRIAVNQALSDERRGASPSQSPGASNADARRKALLDKY